MPSIDVMIPCYNAGRFLAQCIRSVLSQNIDDLRIVVIDNASTDDSVEVARRLAAEDSRVEVVCHAKNLGPVASYNEGVDIARADYFMLLCADDLLTAGSLRRAVEVLESNPKAVFTIGPKLDMIDGENFVEPSHADGWRVTEGVRFIEDCCRHLGSAIALGAVLVRTPAQKAVGHYRASLPHANDLEMALRLAQLGQVVEFEGALGINRLHAAQITAVYFADKLTQLKQRLAVFDSFFSQEGAAMPEARRLHRIAIHRVGDIAYWQAVLNLFRGKTSYGVELLRYCFSLTPASRLFPPLGHFYRSKGSFKRALLVISGRKLGGHYPGESRGGDILGKQDVAFPRTRQ
ncbi:MAG: glycosyltransferase family 2 protein [Mesorhizobium sp.]|uniref:glycosyltransferase family 2 protein n=1 Tax=Mesorhizobium sp. TaxID=1871066 RepID=UPI000FE4C05F|nr:glycosyltransferase family 2 protein [Mesorhizobium sp.]RWC98139.1 MAG: glycosyltransferase family 2 protein [Mesorhizobium sp.]TIW71770.1 MAG: glycosyltransferase family 2 protein [Mesorhizobium sp.]